MCKYTYDLMPQNLSPHLLAGRWNGLDLDWHFPWITRKLVDNNPSRMRSWNAKVSITEGHGTASGVDRISGIGTGHQSLTTVVFNPSISFSHIDIGIV